MQFPGFIGPSYTLDSVNVSAQRCVNLFPQTNEAQGKNSEVASLIRTPGLALLNLISNGPNRGCFTASNGRTFLISGSSFYEYTNLIPIFIGTLSTNAGQCGMDDNGVQLLVVDGLKGYVFTFATNTFLAISDPDFPVASHCCFIDQYIIVNDVNSRRFYLSALSDVTDWDGLDFASKEGSPDNVEAIVADKRELYLVGDTTAEVWQDSGDALFPFIRIPGAFAEMGTSSRFAVKKLDLAVFFPSQDKNGKGIVVRMDRYNPQRVSTYAVEKAIQQGDLSQATAWTYQMDGHSFYCLNVPGLTATWVYDASTGLWHERESWSADGFTRSRAENHCMVNGQHIVGDYQSGNVYAMNKTTYAENGNPLRIKRTYPHLSKETKRVTISNFIVDAETGVGLADGSDPMMVLRYSKDGGHTWSEERTRSMGKQGKYKRRIVWLRVGDARDWVFEISVSDAVPVTLISCFFDASAK